MIYLFKEATGPLWMLYDDNHRYGVRATTPDRAAEMLVFSLPLIRQMQDEKKLLRAIPVE